VHGLGAKSLDNWKKDDHIWIRDDLPKDITKARIMTFGYNAAYVGDATSGRIRDFGKQLLEALRLEREQCRDRPLIFVCHSLGGLVVKRAMVEASAAKARHADIYDSASGIVFLATPHRGSSKASIGKMLVNISKVSLRQNKTQLLAELESDNPSLTDLTEDFSGLHSHFQIASAWELKASKINQFLPRIEVCSRPRWPF
jgi:triacylglycerol esterase/lipase EstA (alpha/beta hydrolase family)